MPMKHFFHSGNDKHGRTSVGMCVRCGHSVMGEKSRCVALDQLFHIDCFRCQSCSESIVVWWYLCCCFSLPLKPKFHLAWHATLSTYCIRAQEDLLYTTSLVISNVSKDPSKCRRLSLSNSLVATLCVFSLFYIPSMYAHSTKCGAFVATLAMLSAPRKLSF